MTVHKVMKRREVAELFGVTPCTVGRWAAKGTFTTIRTLGGHYRFLTAEVSEVYRAWGRQAPPAPR